MKRLALATLTALLTACALADLVPDTFTWTWNRQGTTALASTNVYLSDVTYRATNCLMRIGTATQDLTNCGIIARVGDSYTNRAFVGWIENATNGQFGFDFTIPAKPASAGRVDVMTTAVQIQITNGTVSVTDREQKQLLYAVPLN